MALIDANFSFTYHTSCVLINNYSCLLACPGELVLLIDHPCITGCSSGNFHHQYLTELLVNVYRYHAVVKSISTAVHGRCLLPNSVTMDKACI